MEPNWEKICEGCGECCGCFPINNILLKRFKRHMQVNGKRLTFGKETLIITNDGMCVFLNRQTQKCTIYEHRPIVCRLMGMIAELPCEKLGQDTRTRDRMFESLMHAEIGKE